MDLLDEELMLRARREAYVTATVVWAERPTSGHPGDRALITEEGELHGWVGGSCAEPIVIREAISSLAEDRPRLVHLGPEESARPGAVAVPVACASEGELDIFLQPRRPPVRVVAIGNAPMLDALSRMADAIGYKADVVERDASGRPLELPPADARTAIVVATFGRYDEDALEAALALDAGYLGLVASTKRAATVLGALRRAGVPEERLSRVRAPAGLDLGHVGHIEISVAILADIVGTMARGFAGPPDSLT